jgi:hypothetical protein
MKKYKLKMQFTWSWGLVTAMRLVDADHSATASG